MIRASNILTILQIILLVVFGYSCNAVLQTINFEKDLKKAPRVMRADGSLLPLIEVSGPLGKLSELNHIKLKPLLAVSLAVCKDLPKIQ